MTKNRISCSYYAISCDYDVISGDLSALVSIFSVASSFVSAAAELVDGLSSNVTDIFSTILTCSALILARSIFLPAWRCDTSLIKRGEEGVKGGSAGEGEREGECGRSSLHCFVRRAVQYNGDYCR